MSGETIRILIAGALSSLGFALVFRLSLRLLLPATLGGAVAYAAYLLGVYSGMDIFAANFLGAAAIALFSEICARIFKAPASVVPGRLLYLAMSHLIATEYADAFSAFKSALLTAVGIAAGVIIVSVFGTLFRKPFGKDGKGEKKRADSGH
mgnify:CR=1 FL=1